MTEKLPVIQIQDLHKSYDSLDVLNGADCLGIWAGQSAAEPASAGWAAAETSKISIYQVALCRLAIMR